ncbi:phospholipase D family protein [Pontibacter cellulosilyticus]|uniref:Phospholipase D family protein n=1 Tax=Pontibacter cellulosilyticus TaxID=1720253 RepID=A0A923N375_9BACT|nr:phospholipase D family protein [Pontibacter cellulosilyticus]MBC5991413.1 phospholipase D family protein [Pontibacter cellulosilyticus]
MSKFITGKELEEAVYNIIWEAESQIMIVSPYIKLDAYFKKLFEKHLDNPKIQITLIFGKNEGRVDKSFNKADLDFFKQFPNISIVYVSNLHAKYYANEYMGVLTSINLYDYSFKNNIEFGVLYEPKLLSVFSKSPDAEVWNQCMEIADLNAVAYVKRPIYEYNFLSSDNFKGSKVLFDRTEELYSGKALTKSKERLDEFPYEIDFKELNNGRPTREEVENSAGPIYNNTKHTIQKQFEPGYCIRTGEKIPFNTKSPLSKPAYQSWSKYRNENFAENYCHYSGEPSNGATSFKKPILTKNWKKSQQLN